MLELSSELNDFHRRRSSARAFLADLTLDIA
jgi:hypothetical protein